MLKKLPNVDTGEFEDEVIEQTEEVKAIDNLNLNEEKTYDLIGGYLDADKVLHKTFTVREMTGRDEEAIGKPEVKSNGSKLTSTLLQRCVTSIGTLTPKSLGSMRWQEVIRGLYGADQDHILMKIREVSLGDEIEVNHVCPNAKCGAKLSTVIKTDEFEIEEFKGEREINFTLPSGYKDRKGNHREGYLRLPTGLDRELLTPAAKNNLAKAQTTLLTRLIRFNDDTPVTDDVLMDMTSRDREYLQKLLAKNSFGVKLTFDVTCDVCGTTFPGNLSSSNFI